VTWVPARIGRGVSAHRFALSVAGPAYRRARPPALIASPTRLTIPEAPMIPRPHAPVAVIPPKRNEERETAGCV